MVNEDLIVAGDLGSIGVLLVRVVRQVTDNRSVSRLSATQTKVQQAMTLTADKIIGAFAWLLAAGLIAGITVFH